MDDQVDLKLSDVGRVHRRTVVRNQCGVAARINGSQAPANFCSNFQSMGHHSEQWQEPSRFSNTGEKRGSVPDHRWLVEHDPRIHPVYVVNVQTHTLQRAPSLNQLRSPTLLTKSADSIIPTSWTTPENDGVQQVATEVMLGKARELTITRQQPVLRDVGRASRSSRIASSDRSGKMSHSRLSSRPSSSSKQENTRSARHQPSFSEFYDYVRGECSLPGSANGLERGAVDVPRSQASHSDYQKPETRRGQGEFRSGVGHSHADGSQQSGRGRCLHGKSDASTSSSGNHEAGLPIQNRCSPSSHNSEESTLSDEGYREQRVSRAHEERGPAVRLAGEFFDLETGFPQRDRFSYRSRIKAWIEKLQTSQFEDPELVGPFPELVLQRPHSSLLYTDQQEEPEFCNQSFRSRIGVLIESRNRRTSRSVDSCAASRRRTRDTTSTASTNLPIMAQNSERLGGKGRETVPSAIKGDFIPVSPRKHRSPSPQKHKPNKSVQINLNLTENQVDRLTDVFSNKSESPSRRGRVETFSRNRSPVRNNDFDDTQTAPRAHGNIGHHMPPSQSKDGRSRYEMLHDSDSTTFSELMPSSNHKSKGSLASSIAERCRQHTPTPVNINDRRQYGTLVNDTESIPLVPQPKTPDGPPLPGIDHVDSSSVYSQSEGQPSPLHIKRDDIPRHIENVLQSYSGWKDSNVQAPVPDVPGCVENAQGHGPYKGRLEALRQPVMDASQIYSPLRPYFAYKELPTQKIAGKTLIGEQGWLERPNQTPDRRKDSSPKKPGLLDSLKKMAKDMTDGKSSNRRLRDTEKEGKVKRVTISLDPREQSLLYCELEFHISNALHTYITNELNHGRLNPDKLKKIADGWNQKGRPRVVGFRYDLETQLELVHLHIDEFRFFGRRQSNPLEIGGLLHAMKVNARSLRIRTYCQPDSVIAKQLVDSQSLCNTIGCSDAQQIAIAEIAQFFKVIVEREQAYRANLDRKNTAQTLPLGQGDRQWELSRDLAQGAEPYSGLHLIPEGYDVNTETLRYDN
ncbi:hypothetical protein CTA2_7921 [Colletotrichum tanaceti]|uniref:Uncharacterized protein n=1 Tax=Colletotrichum tanaceti TaxID=1306861 RepID=A0A4U6XVC0_9PEZI|nr:hypothetical protein CTA2_7921 [Colletotrichum tanaceti]TKW59888.1 hypothetical protein CTA1_1409 [Colletotrichum tanaceti]